MCYIFGSHVHGPYCPLGKFITKVRAYRCYMFIFSRIRNNSGGEVLYPNCSFLMFIEIDVIDAYKNYCVF